MSEAAEEAIVGEGTVVEETTSSEDSGFELEIIDDTPVEDQGKARRAEGEEAKVPEDDEITQYSDNVQRRIKQLKYEYHEERRAKEEAARLREEAVSFAQKAYEENKQLRKALQDGEGVLVEQAKGRVDSEFELAKRAYKEAYELGDPDKILDAQERLNKAQIDRTQVESYKPAYTEERQAPVPQAPVAAPQPAAPKVDPKAEEWAKKNDWFNRDTAMTGYAFGVHEDLVRNEGLDPVRDADEYYRRIDESMRSRFPDKFGSDSTEEAPQRQAGSVVAPASRSAKKPRKVQLTSTQVALAKRIGVTPEQYAAQLLKESKNV
jgi:hypothetical protein